MRRLLLSATMGVAGLLGAASPAFAHDGGQGLWGETNDKVTTFAGFILIFSIPLLLLALSMLQARLEKRKYERKSAQAARAQSAQWRGGW